MGIRNYVIMGLIATCASLLMLNKCTYNKLENAENLIEYKNDTVEVYKDKYDRTVYEKASLELDSEKQLKKLAKDNEELRVLYEEVKKEKQKVLNATVFETKVDGVFIGKTDTVLIDTASPCFPTYKVDIKEKWFEMNGFINSEEYKFNPSFKSNMVVLNTVDKKLFKKNSVNTKIKIDNPYFEAENVQTFTTKCNCNKGFYFLSGLGMGVGGGFLLRGRL